MISSLIRTVSGGGRVRKRSILVAYDSVAMIVALWAAFSARLGIFYIPNDPQVLLAVVPAVIIGIGALSQLRVYHLVLRFLDLRAVTQVFIGALVAAAAWVMIVYFSRASMVYEGVSILVPRSVGFIYGGFLFVLLFMGRYAMAMLVSGAEEGLRPRLNAKGRSVAIYGANSAGISLADSMRRDPEYKLCAFIDDDLALHGQRIGGIPIYSPDSLEFLVRGRAISEVFLAMPSATRTQRLAAITRLSDLSIEVKTVPSPEEIVSGRFTVSDVRPIAVNDLLRRDPVEPLTELLREAVDGHTIMITGAGGSIGSEICRQIVRGRPRRLILFDHSEFALYSIEHELLELFEEEPGLGKPELVAIIGSMLNEELVRSVIRRHQVDTIYHAAAYKHVPLLEHNEIVGVENNVVGTMILARVAAEAGLGRFTMISTDKAVRPESVMGASKRVAELFIQALSERHPSTRFGIVRFGNVLDSSGSVVQRFRKQIGRGGPVTVTHRDVTRFFMSIPEATQLVLQASAMASKGEVFVLDMGEPIRITELARNMIQLSGMTVRDEANPHGDVEIVFTGLRPGEKLYEELFVGTEAVPTAHPRIRMAKERSLPIDELETHLLALRAAISNGDASAIRLVLAELIAPEQTEAEAGSLVPAGGVAAPAARTVH